MHSTVQCLLRTQVHILALLLNVACHLRLHENHVCQSMKLQCVIFTAEDATEFTAAL